MLNRKELKEVSLKNRNAKADKNRKTIKDYMERVIMSAANDGRTSIQFDQAKLRLMAFGDSQLVSDILNHYRDRGLSVYADFDDESKKSIYRLSWN